MVFRYMIADNSYTFRCYLPLIYTYLFISEPDLLNLVQNSEKYAE